MLRFAVLCFLISLVDFQTGPTALIETQQTVMAAVGEEAQLSCKLMQNKDVHKVTWWKILPEQDKNILMYDRNIGVKMNPDFRDKISLKFESGLLGSSIVFKSLSLQDEGCYRCVFKTDPEAAFNGTTCLTVYELHDPVLHVRDSVSPEEVVVSCWATGRPAPTVTLTVLDSNSTSVPNANGTVTVNTTAVLYRLRYKERQVICKASVLCGPHKEVATRIPAGKKPVDGWIIILPIILTLCVAFCCVCNHQQVRTAYLRVLRCLNLQSLTSTSPEMVSHAVPSDE